MIDITPSVLEYKPPFTSQSTEYVTVTNNSDQTVAFKVKTTAPKFYCVRPNAAIVAPGEQVQVQVILLGLAEEPTSDFKCRDKFLVITLPAPYDLGTSSVTEAWAQLEAEFKQQAISKKIKVKYLIGEEAQGEDAGKPATTTSSAAAPMPAVAPAAAPASKSVADETKPVAVPEPQAKKASVPDQVITESVNSPVTQKEPVEQQKLAEKQDASLNPSVILFVALIALVLGWLYY
ncbi:LAMI_0D04764g1_1 [Lachancea mirantina]|uniref:LAMI_0D04764g1_1 n=1 Tax=Lachancea mirantina TaxID=1230905 RepID=A0A1G4JAL3_9SACH|nr:LAMI_0D04764g1_1 [Lachancea mirantina]